jgi:valyl-tRNA synthetase
MGDVPFRRVLLHGLVCDETGSKMSKVKGNVIDPLDLVNGATFHDIVAEGEARRALPRGSEVPQGLPHRVP